MGAADKIVRETLRDSLLINQTRVDAMNADTPLFGALPELDSMAVATLLTELEDRLGTIIDDDEVDADMLATFGALVSFARHKLKD